MEVVYFTFGSDTAFPFDRDNYVIALGTNLQNCLDAFKKKHPNRLGSECLNCASYYSKAEWEEKVKNYYKSKEAKEIIVSDTVYGHKPEGFNPIWFLVPSQKSILFLQEGSGDNLDSQDREGGYVDYLDCTSFDLDYGEIEEDEGGMLMLKEYVQDKYTCLADAIPDILECIYGDAYLDAQILKL